MHGVHEVVGSSPASPTISNLTMANLPRKEYFAQLHKLPVAAGALISDKEGKVLLLKPTYRDQFLIPGGMVEVDESPAQAAVREIKEEIGLEINLLSLLCLDYKPSLVTNFNDATLQFIFDGGVVSDEQIQTIKLNTDEHVEYKFFTINEITGLCSPGLEKRILESIRAKSANTCIYLENGQSVAY